MSGAKIVIFRARSPRTFIRSRHMARRYGLFKARIVEAQRRDPPRGSVRGNRGVDLVLPMLRFQILFPHHAFMVLAHALDAVLIVTIPGGKLSHDLVSASGDSLKRMAAAEPNLLAELKFVSHGVRLSFSGCDPSMWGLAGILASLVRPNLPASGGEPF
jgi:hypothetical protein